MFNHQGYGKKSRVYFSSKKALDALEDNEI
jgi:hypothetical protein